MTLSISLCMTYISLMVVTICYRICDYLEGVSFAFLFFVIH